MKTMLCAVALLGMFAVPAGAAGLYPSDQRAVNQQTRIARGAGQGQLTGRETSRLEYGQARVSHAHARAGRDGTVTGQEARHINQMQNRQSRHIFRARHNGRAA